ncbi:TolC family protein [candidate division KSB1 bacterium]|nr:MAG: TolC family protein [candidate division KSB1 bacterium]MBC6948174.1 TolC family protein [candidate division KSB1 bacterium]MCE7940586.1 TolC family protein [Chlorobi bacterium CHB1]MDL1875070.1 TolC family protein [Cytophagia bacterium CHB2]
MFRVFAFLAILIFAGCAARSPYNRDYVSTSIAQHTGHPLITEQQTGEWHLPPGIVLADGLTQDEAVALALWHNAQFQADLTELGFARADLIEAGLLRNPMLSLLFPVGPKQLEATLTLPIEVLWQRPKRMAAAKLETQRVAENLVQHGLDLARDVRVAYADLVLAQAQNQIAEENFHLQAEIAEIAAARQRAGDISALEASTTRLETLRAQEAAVNFAAGAELLRTRLNTLLGMNPSDTSFTLSPEPEVELPQQNLPELLRAAFASRPDLRAAELAIEAAGKRLGWERAKILNLTGVLDANAAGKEGFESGPGAQIELPLFNWNNGKIARAQAQIEQAARQYLAVKHRLALEVQDAYTNYLAAQQALALCRTEWVPTASESARRARTAYTAGEVSYLFVLEIDRQLLEARLREVEAAANSHRAHARLQHSVGFYHAKHEN